MSCIQGFIRTQGGYDGIGRDKERKVWEVKMSENKIYNKEVNNVDVVQQIVRLAQEGRVDELNALIEDLTAPKGWRPLNGSLPQTGAWVAISDGHLSLVKSLDRVPRYILVPSALRQPDVR
jgi:hypothetical protein